MCELPYAVFGFDYYYPCGGWSDFTSRHATAEEATEAALAQVKVETVTYGENSYRRALHDMAQVVDLRDGTIFETYHKERE